MSLTYFNQIGGVQITVVLCGRNRAICQNIYRKRIDDSYQGKILTHASLALVQCAIWHLLHYRKKWYKAVW